MLQFHVAGIRGHSCREHRHHVVAICNRHEHRFDVLLGLLVTLQITLLASLGRARHACLDVVDEVQVVGQHLGPHVVLGQRVAFQRALHGVEAGCVVLVQSGGRGLGAQAVQAFLEHGVSLLVGVLVVLVEVGGLASKHDATVVGAALGAGVQLHALVVEVQQAVDEHSVARVLGVHLFELLADERRAVCVQPFAGRLWADFTRLPPLDVGLVVVLLLLVRLVDAQGFFAEQLLLLGFTVFAVVLGLGGQRGQQHQARGQKDGREFHDLRLCRFVCINRTTEA